MFPVGMVVESGLPSRFRCTLDAARRHEEAAVIIKRGWWCLLVGAVFNFWVDAVIARIVDDYSWMSFAVTGTPLPF